MVTVTGWVGRSNLYMIASFWSTLHGSRLRLKATVHEIFWWDTYGNVRRNTQEACLKGFSGGGVECIDLQVHTQHKQLENKSGGPPVWKGDEPNSEIWFLVLPCFLEGYLCDLMYHFGKNLTITLNQDYATYISKCPNVQAQTKKTWHDERMILSDPMQRVDLPPFPTSRKKVEPSQGL